MKTVDTLVANCINKFCVLPTPEAVSNQDLIDVMRSSEVN